MAGHDSPRSHGHQPQPLDVRNMKTEGMKIDIVLWGYCPPSIRIFIKNADLLENPPRQQATETDHNSQCPPFIVSSFEWKVCICSPAFGDIPPKTVLLQPLRHAEELANISAKGVPYHRSALRCFYPCLALTGHPQYNCQLPTRRCCQT